MKIARLVRLALIAVFAMSLMGTSAASALPSFNPATKQPFTSAGGASTLKASGASSTFTCKEDTSTGEITNAMEVGNIVIHFTGCTSTGGTKSNCTVKSLNSTVEGLLLTATLHGVLGLVLPSNLPALLLLPNSGSEFITLAANECTKEAKVTGSVAGLYSPISTKTVKSLLTFAAGGGGVNEEITEIDTLGGKKEPILTALSVTSTETADAQVTTEKPVEVT